MATKCASAKVSAEKNKFEKMREDLNQKFSELTSLVNQRKLDLDRKIDDLELEYNNKNKQIEKDEQTLIRLREHNAQELSQNSLFKLQENLNEEIAKKIQELTAELEKQLKLELTINWSFNVLQKEIAKIDIKLIKPICKSPPTTFELSDEELMLDPISELSSLNIEQTIFLNHV